MTKKKIVVTGAGGMAGRAFVEGLLAEGHDCIGYSSQRRPDWAPKSQWRQLNILDYAELARLTREIEPDAIVHAASSVFVNECEKESERPAIYNLHVTLTAELTKLASELDSHLLYISTESVYDGTKQGLYIESDATNPLNYYALTKLQGEVEARKWERSLVFRTNILGWRTDNRGSFLEWVLDGLKKRERRTMLTDVTFSPVSTYRLAEDVGESLDKNLTGLFHAGGATSVSKYEVAVLLAKKLELNPDVLVPVTMDQISMGAARPRNTSLDSTRLATALGRSRPTIEDSIDRFLAKR